MVPQGLLPAHHFSGLTHSACSPLLPPGSGLPEWSGPWALLEGSSSCLSSLPKAGRLLYFQILLPSFFFSLFPCVYLLLVLKTKPASSPLFSVPNGGRPQRGEPCAWAKQQSLAPGECVRRGARVCMCACVCRCPPMIASLCVKLGLQDFVYTGVCVEVVHGCPQVCVLVCFLLG